MKMQINKKKWGKLWLSVLSVGILLLSGCQSSKAAFQTQNENVVKENEVRGIKSDSSYGENLSVYFIDTGNSDCILIDAEQTVLIDAGDNDDEERIVQCLKELGISKVDYLINTHPDADHAGGLDAVIENFEIGTVFISNGSSESKTYQDFVYAAVERGLSPSVPLPNQRFYLQEDAYLQFYNTDAIGSGNEVSLIIELVYDQTKMLFMGDAEAKQELEVLNQLEDVDLIKVGHHGSSTSTTQELLTKTKPELAVILCGKDNQYGHPHQEVLDRLAENEADVYRTDEMGTIVARSDGTQISMEIENTDENKTTSDVLVNDEFSIEKDDSENDVSSFEEKDSNASEELYYIGNKNTKKFHLPTCSSLPKKENQQLFDDRDEAVYQGYEPCQRCNP